MDGEKCVLIVDGNNILYRAFYALPRLTSPLGNPTGAVYGFMNMLGKVRESYAPGFVCVVFDAPGPTFRDQVYEEYKGTRQKMPEELAEQLPVIKELIRLSGIKRVEIEGVEADDVIGSLAEVAKGEGLGVVIISSDKDLCQLVGEGVVMFDSLKGKLYDPEAVMEKFGVLPEKIVDLIALSGDTSDNIPGVKGIGGKTAVALLKEFGSVDNIEKNNPFIKGRRGTLIRESLGDLRISKDLARIRRDIPLSLILDDLVPHPPEEEKVEKIFESLGFKGKRGITREAGGESSLPPTPFITLEDRQGVEKAGKDLIGKGVGVSLFVSGGKSLLAFSAEGNTFVVTEALVEELISPLLAGDTRFIFHDMKGAIKLCAPLELLFKSSYDDTMLASYLLHPEESNFSLARMAKRHLSSEMVVPTEGGEKEVAASARSVSRIAGPLLAKLKDVGSDRLYREMEIPLLKVLYFMEKKGIMLQEEILKKLSSMITGNLEEIEEKVGSFSGGTVNLASPKQVSSLLFEKLGLTPLKKTKTGFSTNMEVLDHLKESHEVPALILEHRTLSKLKSTYVDVLPGMVDPETGRIHTSFNQMQTATGRLSSSNPNLQNIPVRTSLGREIRRAFVPREGYIFLGADYSQIEIRVLAHLSGDKVLRKVFEGGGDVHNETAMAIFGIDEREVTSEQRRRAKVVNFGVLYGMTPFGLSKELGISPVEAKKYIDDYFSRYPGVFEFMKKTIDFARERGYVETLFGRRRYIRDIGSRNQHLRQGAERMAMNAPVQGSAADLIKISMVNLWERLKKGALDAHLILQVHDELILEVAKSHEKETAELLREVMEGVVSLDIPLKVDLKRGVSWGDM